MQAGLSAARRPTGDDVADTTCPMREHILRVDRPPQTRRTAPARTGMLSDMPLSSLRFGEFELRPAGRQLLAHGQPLKLGARAFDVLMALVERRERLVAKSELMDVVWPGLVVEENNLSVQISSLRKLLGPTWIATIPGRGYRFTASLLQDEPVASDVAAAPSLPGWVEDSLPLLGRESESQRLLALVQGHRLVTLTGAGGIGKTRLARACVEAMSGHFGDGVAWVDLSLLNDGGHVLPALAQATATALPEGASTAALAQVLCSRTMLIVFDNSEHLAAPVAECARALLAAAPRLRVLVTSQISLQIEGEQVLRLGELALPATGSAPALLRASPAVMLFERRARAADSSYHLDDSGLQQAAYLCKQLDGNPLAIEMAAARAPQIGMSELAQRLGERLRLLRSDERDRPARQQSLRATLAWSHSLLTVNEQHVLQHLAICTGSFGLTALAALVPFDDDPAFDEFSALDALARLVEHALVRIESLDPPRYRLLESPRLFALEVLHRSGRRDAALRRHGLALAALALRARGDIHNLTEQQFINRYAADSADLQAAHGRAVERGDAAVAAACGEAMSAIEAACSGISLRRSRMQAALSLLPLASDAFTRALLRNQAAPASSIAWPGVPRGEAAGQRLAAWQALGDRRETYLATIDLAVEHARAGDATAAAHCADQVLALEDPIWPPALRLAGAMLAADLALYLTDAETIEAARTGLQRARTLTEATGDERRLLRVRFRMAEAATAAGRWPEAIGEGRIVVMQLLHQNRPLTLGMACANLCAAQALSGDDEAARSSASQSWPLLQPNAYAGVLCNHLALLAARAGQADNAALLLGHADAWYAANQSPKRQAVEQRLLHAVWPMIDAALVGCAATRREAGARLGAAEADLLVQRVLSG